MIPADTLPGTKVWGFDWGSAWWSEVLAIVDGEAALKRGNTLSLVKLEKLFSTRAEAYRTAALLVMEKGQECMKTASAHWEEARKEEQE